MILNNRRKTSHERNILQLFKESLGCKCHQCKVIATQDLFAISVVIHPNYCAYLEVPRGLSLYPYITQQFFKGEVPAQHIYLFCNYCAKRFANIPSMWAGEK